jgi:hypothetical protein
MSMSRSCPGVSSHKSISFVIIVLVIWVIWRLGEPWSDRTARMKRLKAPTSFKGAGKPYSLCFDCTAAIDERIRAGEAPSIISCSAQACTISFVAGMIASRSLCASPYVTKPRHKAW